MIPIEALDPAAEHRYDVREHFFAGVRSPNRARARPRYRALTVAGEKRVPLRIFSGKKLFYGQKVVGLRRPRRTFDHGHRNDALGKILISRTTRA